MNGSGKSTLAKILAGLVLPTEGAVWWEGVDGERVELRDADRAQDFPQWQLTAAANVAVGAGDRDMAQVRSTARAADVEALVEGLAHGVGLDRLQGVRARRTAFGRSVAAARHRPEAVWKQRVAVRAP